MTKPVILCVDDERIILDSLKKQLQHGLGAQYRIELAESGEEALEVIDELVADHVELPIIITDEIMQGMYGHELLSHVKQRSPDTLAILLTGQATTNAIGEAVNQAGLYRYFSKPWDAKDLILTVETGLKSYFHKTELDHQHLRNRVLNEMTSLILERLPLSELVNRALKILFSSDLFQSKSEGAVLLTSERSEEPAFVATFPQHCSTVPEVNLADLSNDMVLDTTGWLTIPLNWNGSISGVLMVHTPDATQRSGHNRLFLSSVANTLSGMIQLSRYQIAIEKQNEVLEARVSERTQQLNDALRKQEQLNDILLQANEKLDRLAGTDDLTKLLNRRSFFENANHEVQRRQRYEQSISVMVLDIDLFKDINDTRGHHIGDKVLVELSQILNNLVRKQDIVGRFGGDEFAIVLPETNLREATLLGERIRKDVAQNHIQAEGESFSISISIGLTTVQDGENSIFPAMIRADKALYQSKEQGRNQVSIFQATPTQG